MNQDGQIVAENFAEDFVLHRGLGLASDGIPEFSFDGRKNTLYVRSFVVVLQEHFAMVREKVKRLSEQSATSASRSGPELDESLRPV